MGKLAEERLNESKERALAELNRMLESRAKVEEAWRQAQLAHEQVQAAKNGSDRMSGELRDLLQLIDTFLEESNAKPSVIRNLAEQCTALQISLTPEQVLALTRQINETLASLTDIDAILRDTAGDLGLANALRDRADRAKDKADRMLATARKVLSALDEAAAAQSRAEQAIAETLGHVEAANAHLTHVDGDTAEAQKGAAKAQQDVFKLEERLNELKKRYTQNEYDVGKALAEAQAADQLAAEAEKGARTLEARFQKADQLLRQKEAQSGNVKEQAERLKAKAMKLAEDASVKFSTLRGTSAQSLVLNNQK
jgi:laminin beta 1